MSPIDRTNHNLFRHIHLESVFFLIFCTVMSLWFLQNFTSLIPSIPKLYKAPNSFPIWKVWLINFHCMYRTLDLTYGQLKKTENLMILDWSASDSTKEVFFSSGLVDQRSRWLKTGIGPWTFPGSWLSSPMKPIFLLSTKMTILSLNGTTKHAMHNGNIIYR